MGGDEAWKVADELRDANVPVLVSLDFPKPDRWKPDTKEEAEEEEGEEGEGEGEEELANLLSQRLKAGSRESLGLPMSAR